MEKVSRGRGIEEIKEMITTSSTTHDVWASCLAFTSLKSSWVALVRLLLGRQLSMSVTTIE